MNVTFTILRSTQKQPPEPFYKKAVFKNFAIFTGKYLRWSLFSITLQVFRPATLFKKIPALVFSCEYCKIFKNRHFYRAPPVTASIVQNQLSGIFLKKYREISEN